MDTKRKITAWFIRAVPEILLTLTIIIFIIVVITTADNVGKVKGVSSDTLPAPGGDNSRLFHMVQVSDIHISKFNTLRAEQLTVFCNETIPAISPFLVLNTGDMVDAVKDPESFYYLNEQHEEEWEVYRTVLEQAGYFNKSFWLDLRGNHDAFSIRKYEDPTTNFYLTYAVYGDQRQYNYVISQPFGTYQIVAVDLAFMMGASSPYDFFGVPPKDLEVVKGYLDESENHNHTLLIGHYPRVTSSTLFPWGELTKDRVLAYLCGHLHTTKMYKKMPGGYYELELADMKVTQMYRIMAFDHDLYSFHDFKLRDWPVILITNPKNPQFYSDLEPLDLIARSSHIRVLVFSTQTILSVTVSLNNGPHVNMTRVQADQPLFVLPWNPEEFGAGLHEINVTATDAERVRSVTQSFSVDKTTENIEHSAGNTVQNTPLHTFAIVIFCFIYAYSFFGMLLIPKIWGWRMGGPIHDPHEVVPLFGQIPEPSFWQLVKIVWLEKLMEFQSLWSVTWWIMTFWWLYLLVGPISIGPIVSENRYGASFFWGVVANGQYSRSTESFLFAWVLLLFLYLPFLTTLIRLDFAIVQKRSPINVGFIFHLVLSLVASLITFYLVLLYETWTGFLLSPAVTWFTVSALVLLGVRTGVYWRERKLRGDHVTPAQT